ncbi:MAG: phosphoribosylaminoimidazolesuccinocarboxamide synthase, partial [Actinomycetota bacterium]|nr:phosphoribosylaminoimidazolesuccinocarboxamide synthase [Actinomycetota bacterium]
MSLDGLILLRSGKVRDLYAADDDHVLLVASDRISTFDFVHPTPIPDKGKVLTGLSDFWFSLTRDIIDNHLVSTAVADFPPAVQRHAEELWGRTMLVRHADVVPFECVARGYLTGSGLKEYAASGRVCGIPLPQGLGEAFELPEPIFTPATKAATGHDE